MVLQPYKFSTLSIFQYLCSRFGMKIAKCGGVGKTINYFYPWSRDYSSRGDGRNPFAGITNSNNFMSSHFLSSTQAIFLVAFEIFYDKIFNFLC